MDTDFHKIYDYSNQIINPNKVIAENSLVSEIFKENNGIYGRLLVQKIKSDIHWEL